MGGDTRTVLTVCILLCSDLLSEVSATAGRTDTLQQTFSNVSERAAQVDALVRSLDDFSGKKSNE